MLLLADENFPRLAVEALAGSGHDVVWIRIAAPEMSDQTIFDWAVREGRIILTFDKDFGEIAAAALIFPGRAGLFCFGLQ